MPNRSSNLSRAWVSLAEAGLETRSSMNPRNLARTLPQAAPDFKLYTAFYAGVKCGQNLIHQAGTFSVQCASFFHAAGIHSPPIEQLIVEDRYV